MNDSLESAIFWINRLRAGACDYNTLIGLLRKKFEEASLSFKDIGTSEEEIEELRVLGCKTAAANWLGYLRKGTDQYAAFIGYVREEARKGGLSLKDIGTSEEEIEELRVRGCKVAATFCLKCLRDRTTPCNDGVHFLRQHLKEGGVTPKDIGTSEVELESFNQVA